MHSRLLSFFTLAVCASTVMAQERPSVGPSLPVVREGLVLCLDAATQGSLRQASSMPPLTNRQAVDVWLDGAGRQPHAEQPVAERRPVLVSGNDSAFLRFDGKDDFLSLTPGRELAPAVTIFVLAAPKKNTGMFSALLSTAESGKNDYTSGINVDQGPAGTEGLSVINVESAGAGGFRDLLVPGILGAAERPFGAFHVFTIRSRIGKTGTEVFVDGIKAGERERLESHIGLDQITVGARRYSHDVGQPPYVQGFFAGDMATVLIYNRALTDEERDKVEQQLMARMPSLHALSGGVQGHALAVLENPPLVQMLVPGFTVEELPLRIGNVNNVRYRADGKVVALGYDGRIHLLSDTNGDGLEDRSEPYWDQTTMRGALGIVVSEKGDRHGKGVFVASKGKVSFFPDANDDDRADEEKVIASGWKETFHGVDTLGLARDPKDGSLYFGLGCTNFADGYLIDRNTGKSQYDVRGIRGTIQRLSADFSQQETICSGVRFTCALAFNREGDLFASEQEGATWLPNGNPFDELLHIERGKHYGFPPRHPKHLPDVMDEPAVMEYGPQHQSTVGMVFNEGVNGGPAFGPKFWEGDVIMCGESRGKLWRTKLVKTPQGYVAQNHLLACFGMLLVDACVTPQGDLLLACHSGPPDWGTGPAGEGRLFKIRYKGKDLPQPVMAWASAPDELRIAFDKKLEPSEWSDAAKKIRIEAGPFVSAGDRYETVRPGYQVVRDQMGAPRRWVEVLGLSMSQDQRSLILRVPRQTEPVGYAVTLSLPEAWQQKGGLEQKTEMDVALTLNGVVAQMKGANGQEATCVLPHPSLAVAQELCRGSADHEAFFGKVAAELGAISMSALVDSSNPYVPAVQPGAKLDWDASKDPFVNALFAVRSAAKGDEVQITQDMSTRSRWKPLKVSMGAESASSVNGLFLEGQGRQLALGITRVAVPWAAEHSRAGDGVQPALAKARTDVMGNWMEGRRLFFGEAACFTCHTLRGEGLAFGPDLTNLIHRDRGSVLQDILHPSATINPDQFGSMVKMKDGTSLAGIVRAGAGQTVKVVLPGGAQMEIAREKVAAIEPMKISLMPEDFGKRLTASQQEDLLTFLLTAPLEPAPITRVDPPAPAPRSLKDIAAILPPAVSPEVRAQWKPLRILLVIDTKDHGIDEHDYPLWLERWRLLLSLGEKVQVDSCEGFPSAEKLAKADVTVFYSRNAGWDLRAAKLLDDYQERGGGLVYLHWAIEGGQHALPLAERVGLAFSFSKFRHGDMDLEFASSGHPITKGFQKLKLTDESYWNLRGESGRVSLLATSHEDQAPQPQLWTLERGKGRVFGCIPGHYTWTLDDPLYRLLVLRGICWAAKVDDVERLSELSLIGARVQP